MRALIANLTRRPWLLFLLLPLLILIWSLASGRHDPDDGKLRLTVLDVGQGDCLVLRTPSNRTILIDGGGANDESEAASSDVGDRTVVRCTVSNGICTWSAEEA